MSKGKRVTQKLKRRSKQLFQVSMWMLLVAAFVAGFLYIRRRWAETPSIVPLEDVFGAPFNKHVELEVTIDNKQAGSLRFELLDQVATETAQAFSHRCAGGAHDGNEFIGSSRASSCKAATTPRTARTSRSSPSSGG